MRDEFSAWQVLREFVVRTAPWRKPVSCIISWQRKRGCGRRMLIRDSEKKKRRPQVESAHVASMSALALSLKHERKPHLWGQYLVLMQLCWAKSSHASLSLVYPCSCSPFFFLNVLVFIFCVHKSHLPPWTFCQQSKPVAVLKNLGQL
jgi:hypothetical protein